MSSKVGSIVSKVESVWISVSVGCGIQCGDSNE